MPRPEKDRLDIRNIVCPSIMHSVSTNAQKRLRPYNFLSTLTLLYRILI